MNTDNDRHAFTHRNSTHAPAPLRSSVPCFTTFYRLGVIAQRRLPVRHSYREIGAAVGLTKQNAYTEVVVALGKVVFALRQYLKDPIRVHPCPSVVDNPGTGKQSAETGQQP